MPVDRQIRAVTFDFWNTLIQADDAGIKDRRLTAWLGLMAGEGYHLEPEVMSGAISHVARQFAAGWKANRIYRAADGIDDLLDHLGLDVSPKLREELLASIVDAEPEHYPVPTPNVETALEAIRSAGIPIGIICDVGLSPSSSLRGYLDHHGLLGYFDHTSFSDEVGVFKPDPKIFRHALEGLGGVAPEHAAHIGDLRRTDIAGALEQGILAVRYTGIEDDHGLAGDGTDQIEADVVISDHAELPAALGLA